MITPVHRRRVVYNAANSRFPEGKGCFQIKSVRQGTRPCGSPSVVVGPAGKPAAYWQTRNLEPERRLSGAFPMAGGHAGARTIS